MSERDEGEGGGERQGMISVTEEHILSERVHVVTQSQAI